MGHTYRYTAQRVRPVRVGGQTLEVRSVPTAAVTVAMRDEFPPDAPTGLVAVPGFAGETDAARRPAIDLSWEPNAEPRIAGYRVYRRDSDAAAEAWQRLNAELVAVAAYRDATVVAGHRYAYRVTAVNEAGRESAQSGDAVETAPGE
jgi:fibronectin type 3 domain-containing protein